MPQNNALFHNPRPDLGCSATYMASSFGGTSFQSYAYLKSLGKRQKKIINWMRFFKNLLFKKYAESDYCLIKFWHRVVLLCYL